MPNIYEYQGKEIIGSVEATAICGVDFCDHCGDCLPCYGEDPCYRGSHLWVIYEDDLEEFLKTHGLTMENVEMKDEKKQVQREDPQSEDAPKDNDGGDGAAVKDDGGSVQ